eukprot:CAMPEP_0118879998 /NCGR_PEP_ID=MMETSP1163-20130328/19643_1 /TAXON_ID=124430 /ORGANISM="Phaeomonas parva, Strain CCMP2877" /LENGTH=53 /DNA_ID=CAMNT_0006816275 /DNA_START=549 /DNA_END=707 /DNA_ORIENTATION=+
MHITKAVNGRRVVHNDNRSTEGIGAVYGALDRHVRFELVRSLEVNVISVNEDV